MGLSQNLGYNIYKNWTINLPDILLHLLKNISKNEKHINTTSKETRTSATQRTNFSVLLARIERTSNSLEKKNSAKPLKRKLLKSKTQLAKRASDT